MLNVMNILKKSIFAVIIPLAGIAFMTSCSKEPEANKEKAIEKPPLPVDRGDVPATGVQSTAPKRSKKGKSAVAVAKANAKATDKADAASPANGDSLTVVRDGQYANLSWHTDVPSDKIKAINILRSPTGLKDKKKVAALKPDAANYRDTLPDGNAQWYWVNLVMSGAKVQSIGPVRVEADRSGAANYSKPEDAYQISITRTDDTATLKWEFPDEKYTEIQVVRNTRPVAQPFRGGGDRVVVTLEGKSQYTNPLKNPNAEYWYWFRITSRSGTIIFKGPIKAEYVRTKK